MRRTRLALDAAGNLLIVDTGNASVRRVDATTGMITAVAGVTGRQGGATGDGGPATSAHFFTPIAVAVDQAGDLFITDSFTGTVRRVDAGTGLIATVAGTGMNGLGDGGPATSAGLSVPKGVAVDSAGDLFIADSFDYRVRRVDGTSGQISSVTGNGTATFSGDGGPATSAQLAGTPVAVDASGNVFIADSTNNRIRRVDATTGVITTVAGDGTAGPGVDGVPATSTAFHTPTAVTVDSAGNLFIADTLNNRVRRVDATTGVITTVAGDGTDGFSGDGGPATIAEISSSFWGGLAVDSAGNLFIADTGNQRVRRVDAITGVITTVAGTGTRGFSGDGGPATHAQLDTPVGVAVDAAGNLFIADDTNNRIRKVDVTTGVITTVAGTGTGGFSGDGGPATGAQLAAPIGVAVDAAGNLFIADTGNQRVRRVDAATGVITTVAGTGTGGFAGDGGFATSAQLAIPLGVAVDAAGDVLVADAYNVRVRRIDAATGTIATFAGGG